VLIDKTHLGWGSASAVVLAASAAGYAASTAGGRTASGGSVAGLVFGALALAAMIFAGLLAVRKKFPGLRLGSAQFWLRGHIWLGLLSVPLVFFHSGFRFGGTLERGLMIVFLIVIASGVYGLALQQALPRILKVRVPLETFPQQIPMLCQKFQDDGAKLVDGLKKVASRRATSILAPRAPIPAGSGAAKPPTTGQGVGKGASVAEKIAAMKAGAAKASTAEAAASKPEAIKGVAAKSVDKGASVAEKIAAMKAAAAAKAAGAASPEPATTNGAEAATNSPSPAETATEKPSSPALDNEAFMAQLAAKKAAAKASAAPAAATAPALAEPAQADKPAVGDKAAFLAALAAKKAAAGPSARKAPRAAAPAPLAASQGAGQSTMSRTAEAGMPRLSLLLRFYEKEVSPFFNPDERTARRQRLASENYARMAFANLAAELPSQALETIEKLESMVAERRQFLVQERIQRWLRNWLLIHVPLSAALFVLAALHLIVALRVVPWS